MDFLRPFVKFILFGMLALVLFGIAINIAYPYIACGLESIIQKIYTIVGFMSTNLPYTLMAIRIIIVLLFVKLVKYLYDKFVKIGQS